MKPEIISTLQSEGIALQKRGANFWAPCPFHAEKTPSFSVSESKQRFKCFGCGESGDVIDFIQKKHAVTYLQAKKYLKIGPDQKTRKEIEREKQRAELVERFRDWEARYSTYLGKRIRLAHKLLSKATPEQIDLFGAIYHGLSMWEYHLDVLVRGTDQDKFNLYRGRQWNSI